MAVPSNRAVGTAVFGTAGTLSPTVPTQVAGDVLVCFVGSSANASVTPTHSMPAGWVQVATAENTTGTTRSKTTAFAKVTWNGAEPTPTVTVTPTGAGACHHSAVIISYQNARLDGSIFDGTSTGQTAGASVQALTLTTAGANELAIAAAMHSDNVATGATTASNVYTQRVATDDATGIDGFLYVGDFNAGSGSGQGTTVTFTSGGTGVGVSGLVFALKEKTTWAPSSGHSWEQPPTPPAMSAAARCVALGLVACSYVGTATLPAPTPPLNAVRFQGDHDGLYTTGIGSFSPQEQTWLIFVRYRTSRTTGPQMCAMSQEANNGTAHYFLDPETTASANTVESHDSFNGGGFIISDDAPAAGEWWCVAETNTQTGPTTILYTKKVGTGGSMTAKQNNDHGVFTDWTRLIVGTDDAQPVPNSPQNEWLDGDIAGIKFWSRALSAGELDAEKAQLAPVSTTGLQFFYDFQALTTGLQDKSGTGKGTLTNIAGLFGFPSGADGRTLRTDGPEIPYGSWFTADQLPQPEAPDQHTRPWRDDLYGSGAVQPLVVSAPPAFDPANGFPYPGFPDFARAPQRAQLLGGPASLVVQEREPSLDWAPEFVDFPGRLAPRPNVGPALAFTKLEYEPNLDWLPSFPDFARAAARPVPEGLSVYPIQEREPALDWLPSFPDRVLAAAPRLAGGLFQPPYQPPAAPSVPPLAWLPSFPDFARGAPPRIEGGHFAPVFFRDLDLRGWWKLDGNSQDSSGYGNHGTDSAMSYPTDGRIAGRGKFNGSTSVADVGSSPRIKPTTAITVAAWVRIETPSAGRYITDWHQNGSEDRWLFYSPDGVTLQWYMHAAAGGESGVNFFTGMPAGWVHLVGTFDGATQKRRVYVNGVDSGGDTGFATALVPGSTGTVRLGVQLEAGSGLIGSLDDVRIYGRALEATEVAALFAEAPRIGLDWLPVAPDQVRGAARPVGTGELVSPPQQPAAPAPPLSWAPEYPDLVRGPLQPNPGPALAFVKVEREPQLDWLPSFPDFARAARAPVNQGGASMWPGIVGAPPPAPLGSWYPTFPDFARGPAPRQLGLHAFVAPEREPALDWLPSFPDQVRAPARVPSSAIAAPLMVLPPLLPSWAPSYPDQLRCPARAPSSSSSFVPLVLPPLTWLATFPDFTWSTPPRPSSALAWVRITQASPVAGLEWLPTFPDFARGAPRPVNAGGMAFSSPPLAWSFGAFVPAYWVTVQAASSSTDAVAVDANVVTRAEVPTASSATNATPKET